MPPTPPKYDQDLRDFLETQRGYLVMLTDDPLFVRTLRTTVLKALGVRGDCLAVYQEAGQALRSVRDHLAKKYPVLVLVDRLLNGLPTLEFMRSLKGAFAEAKVLVMTQETSKAGLSQLYEIGVDSILTKPVSVATLIEKMAGAIKPQGKLSQLVQEARRLLELGDTVKAKLISKSILKIKPNSPVALMLLGDALIIEGKRDEAIKAYEEAHQGATLYLEPLKKLAGVHQGEDDESYLHYLKKLDVISPLNTSRKCEIGKVYVRRKDMDKAEIYFGEAIVNAQREASSYVDQIVSDIAESVSEASPAMAEKYYFKMLEMKGDNLTKEDMVTFNRLGIALRKQGKWKEAIENYKKALTVAPGDERVLYNMGLAYGDGQQHRQAVDCYEQALRSDPEFHRTAAVVSFNMASGYHLAKQNQTAQKFALVALELDPDHANAKKLLATLKAGS
ncbi:MAG: response regulator [Deltaproteobacteria bacterium HGW-Deltaproteobacteria-8]|jgi:tetratricopeptide (TPR) repeat protein|nr:MAG: response regulator [Deltaproteobacteria bacterium HGW-Deltaproteobacteria-8]